MTEVFRELLFGPMEENAFPSGQVRLPKRGVHCLASAEKKGILYKEKKKENATFAVNIVKCLNVPMLTEHLVIIETES